MAYKSKYVEQIQKVLGLDTDGIIGPNTDAAIHAAGGLKEIIGHLERDLERPDNFDTVTGNHRKGLHLLAKIRGEIGVTELDNPDRVISYGGETVDEPWCAHLINWCLREIGEKDSGSGRAASFKNYGVASTPCPGAIVGWDRPSHVGVIDQINGDSFTVVSGNMSNSVLVHPITSNWGFNTPPSFVRMIL